MPSTSLSVLHTSALRSMATQRSQVSLVRVWETNCVVPDAARADRAVRVTLEIAADDQTANQHIEAALGGCASQGYRWRTELRPLGQATEPNNDRWVCGACPGRCDAATSIFGSYEMSQSVMYESLETRTTACTGSTHSKNSRRQQSRKARSSARLLHTERRWAAAECRMAKNTCRDIAATETRHLEGFASWAAEIPSPPQGSSAVEKYPQGFDPHEGEEDKRIVASIHKASCATARLKESVTEGVGSQQSNRCGLDAQNCFRPANETRAHCEAHRLDMAQWRAGRSMPRLHISPPRTVVGNNLRHAPTPTWRHRNHNHPKCLQSPSRASTRNQTRRTTNR